jgi:hypothetical protein
MLPGDATTYHVVSSFSHPVSASAELLKDGRAARNVCIRAEGTLVREQRPRCTHSVGTARGVAHAIAYLSSIMVVRRMHRGYKDREPLGGGVILVLPIPPLLLTVESHCFPSVGLTTLHPLQLWVEYPHYSRGSKSSLRTTSMRRSRRVAGEIGMSTLSHTTNVHMACTRMLVIGVSSYECWLH